MRHGLGGLLPEGDEGVLVQDQRVREHVAPGEKEQINSLFKKLITFFTIPTFYLRRSRAGLVFVRFIFCDLSKMGMFS